VEPRAAPSALHHAVHSWGKRGLDVLIALVGLALLWPLLLITAIVIRVSLGSPILFTQKRPGLHGRPFLLRKFRTMRDAVGHDGRLLPDALRMTRLGCFLRATSIDELPELWNVLIGDMSLVGPRPWLMEYLPHFTPEQQRRHDVRPGITGWAQINGRNEASWDERLRLDIWYVDHWSWWLDLRILLRTAWIVVRREGISAAGHATMTRFDLGQMPPSENPLAASSETIHSEVIVESASADEPSDKSAPKTANPP
jgi:sugar transferase EpsL